MKNLLNAPDRENLIVRLQNLTPGVQRKWGKMSIQEVLPHLADPFRATLGEKKVRDVSNAMTRGLAGKMLLRWLPWPQGAATSPDFLPGHGLTPSKTFEEDRQSLILLIHRFSCLPENTPLETHPVFGPLSHQDLGRLYWRHIDHHLRQFGS